MRFYFRLGIVAAIGAVTLLALRSNDARMMAPRQVPTERLLKNLTDYTKANPKDADGFYALGRVQYAIYCATDPRTLPLYKETVPVRFPGLHPNPFDPKGKKLKDDPATCRLVADAVANLQKAISLDKGREPGLYHLTLACVYEAAAPIAAKVQKQQGTILRAEATSVWREMAIKEYLAAYDAAVTDDLKQKTRAMSGTWESWISVEAGDGVKRLAPNHPRSKEITARLAQINALPAAAITPLIFSLTEAKPLDNLLAPERVVGFDLYGTGTPKQRWSWVQPDTAFLVWQPDGKSPIRSGRQLFGSATWWMMFKDAYAALSALDNDGDGWLTGKELNGLAVWQDRNQNGKWDAGETTPLTTVGVVGLATQSTQTVGDSLANPAGLRMNDGRTLPTYDWVTQPSH